MFERQVSEYLTLSLYSDIPTLDTDTIGADKGVIFDSTVPHPSNAGIGESSADELQTDAPNVHSSESEALPASPSSSRSQSACKHSPLMSDSGDDYVPSTEKKSKRMYPELVCTRLSSGKQPKFVVNLNSHVARKLCPNLKAAREEEDCNSRAPQQPRALRGSGTPKHAGDSHRTKKRKLNNCSAS